MTTFDDLARAARRASQNTPILNLDLDNRKPVPDTHYQPQILQTLRTLLEPHLPQVTGHAYQPYDPAGLHFTQRIIKAVRTASRNAQFVTADARQAQIGDLVALNDQGVQHIDDYQYGTFPHATGTVIGRDGNWLHVEFTPDNFLDPPAGNRIVAVHINHLEVLQQQ